MREELEESLANEFPFMKRGDSYIEQEKRGEIRDLFGAFGCEVGNGWYEVLRGLCNDVNQAYRRAGLPVDLVVDRVKEKLGSLRFSYHRVDSVPGIHANSLDGGTLQAKPGCSELDQEVAGIVKHWQDRSMGVCESCGAAGVLRRDLRRIRRIQTLCEQCYAQRNKKSTSGD